MSEKILITSALPYANGPLHFGHIAGAYLPGDCYARFQRLMGKDVLYICGSDEYGIAVTLSAELAGKTPQEQVDQFHKEHQAFFQALHFSFDFFGRTTSSTHAETTKEFFLALEQKGFIEEKEENHLYSLSEKRFLADRYVVGVCPKCGYEEARGDECQKCGASYEATDLKNPRSKLTGSSLILKPSKHLYLKFEQFQKRLMDWIAPKKWKDNVLQFAKHYIEDLHSRAITRDSDWGVPVPGYPEKVFYVWFDAPIGYVSIVKEWAKRQGDASLWEKYWLDSNTKLVHFIGKDNIPFHAVFFPAMLMGQTIPFKLPDEIPANEFYLLEGKRFSKSEGWFIDLDDFFTKYTSDQIRYMLAASAPETADSEFSWKEFQVRCNAELLGKFGNFIHRVLTFTKTYLKSQVPSRGNLDEKATHFLQEMSTLMEWGQKAFEGFQLRKATHLLMDLAQKGNIYFDQKKPWVLAKDPSRKQELETVISCCLECIRNLALLASPILPETAEKSWHMLGYLKPLSVQKWEDVLRNPLPIGQILPEPAILFRKIEEEEIEKEIQTLGRMMHHPVSVPAYSYLPLKENISFDQFEALDFRVGQILEAGLVPKSKKLLKLFVDLGFEKRTIVSGIALSYSPEALIGKKVMILVNLTPAKIMGVESQGMILAGALDKMLELPFLQELPPGSSIS